MPKKANIMNFKLPPENFWIILALAMWELIWKGLALWKAARNDHRYVFTAILFINSLGILPITYLLFLAFRNYKSSNLFQLKRR